jgi:hypothetical protein
MVAMIAFSTFSRDYGWLYSWWKAPTAVAEYQLKLFRRILLGMYYTSMVSQMPQIRKYVRKDEGSDADATGKTCNIKGCSAPAVRSLSKEAFDEYLRDARLELKSDKERKITPCDEHYKAMRKIKKKDDKITKAKHGAGSISKVGSKGIGSQKGYLE